MKWAYMDMDYPASEANKGILGSSEVDQDLRDAGDQEWEMVAVNTFQDGGQHFWRYTFKRAIQRG
jgi:hypothetical protein